MTNTMSPPDRPPASPPEGELPTWPDLALGLYARLTGRGAGINYELREMVVEVPQRAGADAPRAVWRLNGTLRVTTDEPAQRPPSDA
jgi:hypothetical protein